MTKLVRFEYSCSSKEVCYNPEVERLFKQEKVKSWQATEEFIILEIPDNEDVKL